jgi:chromosomal replication initiation ATPase DnaA
MIKERLLNTVRIIKATEKITGKSANILRGSSRHNSVVLARNLCYKIAKEHLYLSDQEISRSFGRDRSAITYALKQTERKLGERPQYKKTLEAIEEELGLNGC